MNVAVLLAGGSGRRMGGPEPKQFIQIAGRSILEHSIRAFHKHEGIDEIVVVAHADYIDHIREIAAPYPKVRHIVPGGKERLYVLLYQRASSPIASKHSRRTRLSMSPSLAPTPSWKSMPMVPSAASPHVRCCAMCRHLNVSDWKPLPRLTKWGSRIPHLSHQMIAVSFSAICPMNQSMWSQAKQPTSKSPIPKTSSSQRRYSNNNPRYFLSRISEL